MRAAAQAGLVHFTRSISGRLAKSGVRLCCLCPQPVDTPMVSTMQSLGLPMPETGASLLTPLRVSQLALCWLQSGRLKFHLHVHSL